MNISYIATGAGNLSIWIRDEDGSTSHTITSDNEKYKLILELLRAKKNEELVRILRAQDVTLEKKEELVSLISETKNSLTGKAKFVDGEVFINDVPIHSVVSDRISQLANEGLPIEPVLRFLENVMMNPSSRSQQELYDFLANRNLPLTEDGCFLAYKRIRQDWLDIYSGTIDNSIGNIVSVPRENVDSDRERECSYGLHVGGLDYVRWYGQGSSDSRVVIVKVNPQHCVSVPKDHSHQKLRTCQYEVLYELTKDEALKHNLYNDSGIEGRAGFTSPNSDWGTCSDDIESGWDNDYESWSTARLRETLIDMDFSKEEIHDMDRCDMISKLEDLDQEEEERLYNQEEDYDSEPEYEEDYSECGGDCASCNKHVGSDFDEFLREEDSSECGGDCASCNCSEDDNQSFVWANGEESELDVESGNLVPGSIWELSNPSVLIKEYPEKSSQISDKLGYLVRVENVGTMVTYRPGMVNEMGNIRKDLFLRAFTFVI